MLPLIAIVAFAALQALAAGVAAELADHAAEAGAVAILEGADPHDAAEHAIPGWSGAHIDVAVHDKTVRVRVRPPARAPRGRRPARVDRRGQGGAVTGVLSHR